MPSAMAAAIREARLLDGVRDVVSTYRSVAVLLRSFDCRHRHRRGAAARARGSCRAGAREGKTVVIPVEYGGDAGPDLADVAAFAGVAPTPGRQRSHAEAPYRVFMLGFLPGFAYMGSVDEAIAMPRHATPRLRVPAGSVGIAGRQTGIYPRDSPGGWQHHRPHGDAALRSRSRSPAALLAPGDTVRFVARHAAIACG